jgi:GeoRSP system radical SAM/SPASM protein
MKSEELLSAPLTVNWSLSYSCNFTCSHCYSRLEKETGLPVEEIKGIVDILAGRGVVFINFGGGEPLIYSHLHEVTRYAVEKGLKVTMNTNGWLLDREAAAAIASSGFSSVGVSIDSAVGEDHDTFRNRPGSFERAVQALDNLAEAGIRTTVSCVIHRDNLDNWEGMVDVARDHGASTLYLHNYKCSGMGKVNMDELDLTPGQWESFYRHALDVQKGLEDLKISFDDPIMASLPDHSADSAVPGSTCGKLSLHIGPDGDITPCGFIPLSIGNILEDDFDSIWFDSPVLRKMRAKTAQGKCQGCGSWEDCLGGCTARVFAMTGSFEEPDPHCWVEEDE